MCGTGAFVCTLCDRRGVNPQQVISLVYCIHRIFNGSAESDSFSHKEKYISLFFYHRADTENIYTYNQFRVTNSPNMHIIGLWEETHTDTGRTETIHTENLNPGPSCYEMTVLTTQPLCHLNLEGMANSDMTTLCPFLTWKINIKTIKKMQLHGLFFYCFNFNSSVPVFEDLMHH